MAVASMLSREFTVERHRGKRRGRSSRPRCGTSRGQGPHGTQPPPPPSDFFQFAFSENIDSILILWNLKHEDRKYENGCMSSRRT